MQRAFHHRGTNGIRITARPFLLPGVRAKGTTFDAAIPRYVLDAEAAPEVAPVLPA